MPRGDASRREASHGIPTEAGSRLPASRQQAARCVNCRRWLVSNGRLSPRVGLATNDHGPLDNCTTFLVSHFWAVSTPALEPSCASSEL
eukprot:4693480-Prymnesium_polylepis.1